VEHASSFYKKGNIIHTGSYGEAKLDAIVVFGAFSVDSSQNFSIEFQSFRYMDHGISGSFKSFNDI